MKTMKNTILNSVATFALAVANTTVHTTCTFDYHQPKVPEKVKKLKK